MRWSSSASWAERSGADSAHPNAAHRSRTHARPRRAIVAGALCSIMTVTECETFLAVSAPGLRQRVGHTYADHPERGSEGSLHRVVAEPEVVVRVAHEQIGRLMPVGVRSAGAVALRPRPADLVKPAVLADAHRGHE